jgi:ferric iron reductase protein FhuF
MSADIDTLTVPYPIMTSPRFAAVTGRPEGWVPAGALFGSRLDEHLRAVARTRGAAPAVAGTLLLQRYAALLVAPVLAALCDGAVLDARMSQVSVSCEDGMPSRLAFADPPGPGANPALLLLDASLWPAADAVHAATRAGLRVLRGAVANEIALAYLHLSWPRPDHAHHLADARAFLAAAGLADLVDVAALPVDGALWFHAERRTCCLAFRCARNRAHPDPYCAICPVVPGATIRGRFEEAVRDYQRRHPDPPS